MLLEPLFAIVCSGIGNETPGKAQAPCQSILNAGSEQSKTSQTMNELQSYSEHFVYKNVNEDLIKATISIGYVLNSINEKSMRAQIPLNPFEIDLNLGLQVQNFGVKYKYDF